MSLTQSWPWLQSPDSFLSAAHGDWQVPLSPRPTCHEDCFFPSGGWQWPWRLLRVKTWPHVCSKHIETQNCFLEFLSHVFFPPGVMWFSTVELKSFTNNPTDFRGFCWKITLTIHRKTSAPGDELATCLHSIGFCCLSPASAYDTPERLRQWQTPWENVWPCCLGRGYACEPCKQRNHRPRVDKNYQCIFLLEQGGWYFCDFLSKGVMSKVPSTLNKTSRRILVVLPKTEFILQRCSGEHHRHGTISITVVKGHIMYLNSSFPPS